MNRRRNQTSNSGRVATMHCARCRFQGKGGHAGARVDTGGRPMKAIRVVFGARRPGCAMGEGQEKGGTMRRIGRHLAAQGRGNGGTLAGDYEIVAIERGSREGSTGANNG